MLSRKTKSIRCRICNPLFLWWFILILIFRRS